MNPNLNLNEKPRPIENFIDWFKRRVVLELYEEQYLNMIMKEYGIQEYTRGLTDGRLIEQHGTTSYQE